MLPLQIRQIVDTYSNVKSDVDEHAAHMDSLVDIPTECIPSDYQVHSFEMSF